MRGLDTSFRAMHLNNVCFHAGPLIRAKPGLKVEFAQAVKPEKYRLFQLADLVCTLKLIETRLCNNLPMTDSEYTLFGGPRKFKRSILKFIKQKEI